MQCRRPGFDPWVRKISWRRERLPTPAFWPREFHGLCSPWGYKESDTTEWISLSLSFILQMTVNPLTSMLNHLCTHWLPLQIKANCSGPWVGKILWRRALQPTRFSFLENPMDGGAWQATVPRVTKSWTWLKQLSKHTVNSVSGLLKEQHENPKHPRRTFYFWL